MINQSFLSHVETAVEGVRRRDVQRSTFLIILAIAMAFSFVACSKEKEAAAAVPVKAVTVQKTAIQRVIAADAVLFPLQQAALVPKITAPVKTFYVNRGAKVHKGQLLAVLENRDLAASQEENKGAFEQAEAACVTGTQPACPKNCKRLQAAHPRRTARRRAEVYDSRLDLFKQGALPRKDRTSRRRACSGEFQYELGAARRLP
jgi:multidrug efflux pump subunit AcrA (membrane-fusion protein)